MKSQRFRPVVPKGGGGGGGDSPLGGNLGLFRGDWLRCKFPFFSSYMHTFGKIDYCILFLISIKISKL